MIFLGLTNDVKNGFLHCLKGLLVYLIVFAKGAKIRPYLFRTMPKARIHECLTTWRMTIDLYKNGDLDPLLGSEYDFKDAVRAHEEMDAGRPYSYKRLTVICLYSRKLFTDIDP